MKKIINKPENYVNEMLEGLYIAHPDMITYTADSLGGEHIFALVLSDVPAVGSVKFEMTAYVTIGDKEYTEGVSYVVELVDGVCVASYMVIG